jgi:hypothetical protein
LQARKNEIWWDDSDPQQPLQQQQSEEPGKGLGRLNHTMSDPGGLPGRVSAYPPSMAQQQGGGGPGFMPAGALCMPGGNGLTPYPAIHDPSAMLQQQQQQQMLMLTNSGGGPAGDLNYSGGELRFRRGNEDKGCQEITLAVSCVS